MLPISVLKIFEIARRGSVLEPFFNKVTEEVSVLYDSAENSIMWVVPKRSFFRNFGISFNGVLGLEPKFTNATKNEILVKFIKVVLKLSKIFQEGLCNGLPS